MSDIFISYKSDDRARVKPLVEALTAEGLSVWWDVEIEGGAAWRQVIQDRLDAAACVLVVWSAKSVGPAGRFVQDEAARADRRGVYLPVAIDAVEPPLGFGQQKVLPLTGWHGNRHDVRFTDVLAAAKAIVGHTAPPAPHAIDTGRRPWRLAGLAAAAVALLAGLALVAVPGALCGLTGLRCETAGAAHAARNSIAVLPFANLSGDPAQEYFSDGLSEELLSALARLNALQVAARTSSFKFKGSKADSAAIGKALGVAYILDGSVRREGNMVRVSAQLVEAKTGFERWSQTYDGDAKDIFAVQTGIATAVAEALKVHLLGNDIAALSRGGTKDAKAYDAFLRGWRLFNAGGGEDSFRTALAEFDAAIAADPRFAAAHAARARTLVAIANQFAAPDAVRSTFDAALVSARTAVKLAPDLAEAQLALATTLRNARLDFAAADAAYRKAMITGSGNADVLLNYGLFSCRIGNCDAGLAALRRGVMLDPLNPRAYKSLGLALVAARQYPEAIKAFERTLALNPGSASAHAGIGDSWYLQGKLAAARSAYALEPQLWDRVTGEAIVLHRLGDRAGAKAAFAALIADGGDATAYQQAQIYAQWGDRERAFAALDTAFNVGDPGLAFLNSDPMLEPLRGSPQFAALLARLGLKQ